MWQFFCSFAQLIMSDNRLHSFSTDVSGIEPPRQFTFPFHYVPHKLCTIAAKEIIDYALNNEHWHDELMEGKMLGVLVASDNDGKLGFLAAFSGNLCHSNNHPYFVPPIYDLLQPNGEFRNGEAQINNINAQISELEASSKLEELKDLIVNTRHDFEQEEVAMRTAMEQEKAHRHALRESNTLTPEQKSQLIKDSQFQKAEYRRLKKRHCEHLETLEQQLAEYQVTINKLKTQRKEMSEALQRRLFELFVVNNAKGEESDVATIFEQRLRRLPPGGTGECCAPKLLQHAYHHHLTPLCMAEFWVGKSPQGEVRHHGHYYPACRSKCLPLLDFMLQGLDVEKNLLDTSPLTDGVTVAYDDQWLAVVDKPAGILTVPGKSQETTSVQELVKKLFPNATGPLVVHRLDQATSGLVLIAKTKEVHKLLQSQFATRSISKRYIALLDGIPKQWQGEIILPLRLDPDDRPRQIVDYNNGDQAVTHYKMLQAIGGKALVEFRPLTGRTHQLRVHASHHDGLNCPIVGDMLYGTASHRLCLHAQSLSFTHPVTGEQVTVTSNREDFLLQLYNTTTQ